MDIVGATALASPGVENIWMKTHIRREGTHLVAHTVLVDNDGVPGVQILKAEIDLTPIAKRLMAMHRRRHGDVQISGLWNSIKRSVSRTARSIGRNKLVKQISRAGRSVIRSKITSGVIAATAVAFPAVGVPAAAAHAAANVALNYVEKGERLARNAKRIANRLRKGKNFKRGLKKLVSKKGPKALRGYLKKNPKARAYLSAVTKFERRVRRGLSPKKRKEMAKVAKQYNQAKQFFEQISKKARFGHRQEQLDAKKMARIIRLAAKNRAKVKKLAQELKGGMPGILIDRQGNLTKGRYVVSPGARRSAEILVTPQGAEAGTYRAFKIDPKKLRRLKAQERKLAAVKKRLKDAKKRAGKSRKGSRDLRKQFAKRKRALKLLKRKLARLSPAKRKRALKGIMSRIRKMKSRAIKRAASRGKRVVRKTSRAQLARARRVAAMAAKRGISRSIQKGIRL